MDANLLISAITLLLYQILCEMLITRIFLAFVEEEFFLAKSLFGKLKNYNIITNRGYEIGEDSKSVNLPSLELFDGAIFLINQYSLLNKEFYNTLDVAVQLAIKRKKFLIPIIIGDPKLPDFLKEFPLAYIGSLKSIIATSDRIVSVVSQWVEQGIFHSYDSEFKEQKEFYYNLLVNLNAVTTTNQYSNFPYLNDWIDDFWRLTKKTPQLSDNVIIKRILDKLHIIEKDIKNSSANFYFLKINAATWIISDLVPGKISRFHTHDLQANRRVDYDLFTSLKVGDLLIGYVFQEYNAVLCVFKIIQTLNVDQQHGEGVTLSVHERIDPSIPLVYFKDKIDFIQKLGPNNPERLFKISKSLFDSILETKVAGKRAEPGYDIDSSFSGDIDFESTFDQLDFQNDINSFASIITLQKIKPPLAIGLFGEWGAGKSFFMQKLSEQIAKLSEKRTNRYVKNVVQVKFNAWHYSDGNLWASLVTHIFEELNSYAHKGNFNEESVKDLYSKLDLTSVAIAENEDQIALVGDQLNDIEAKKNELEEIIKDKKLKLSMLSNHDIMGVIFKDPSIQAVVKLIKKDEPTSQLINNLEEINGRLDEYNSFFKRIYEAFTMIKKPGKWWKVGTVLMILTIGVFCFFFPPFKENINSVLVRAISFSGALSAFLAGFDWLKPYLKTVEKYYNRLKRLKDSIQSKAEELEYSETNEIQKLELEIDKFSKKESALNKELEEKRQEKSILESKIDDIGTGRIIAKFLAGKSNEESYNNELGIISKIRKDFTQLNKLFKQQNEIIDEKYTKGERFQIDRIILYIDDLDRCNSDIVTKTLEAVHLLLAFELFVVVVGVDPRWLKSSLLEKYSYFSDDKKDAINQITSFDYLEKIFQIPFTLKAVSPKGRNKLIQYLTEADLEQPQSIDEGKKEKLQSEKSLNIKGLFLEEEINENSIVQNDKTLNSMDIVDTMDISEEFEIEIQERITLSLEEIEAMQTISFLYGHTPRKIKRYVNIYRIIKAHRNYSISAIYSKNDYLPTMVTLAIVVGFPEFIKELKEILQNDSTLGFEELLESIRFENLKLLLQELPSEIKSTINSSSLSENFDLISRFSFRTN